MKYNKEQISFLLDILKNKGRCNSHRGVVYCDNFCIIKKKTLLEDNLSMRISSCEVRSCFYITVKIIKEILE